MRTNVCKTEGGMCVRISTYVCACVYVRELGCAAAHKRPLKVNHTEGTWV